MIIPDEHATLIAEALLDKRDHYATMIKTYENWSMGSYRAQTDLDRMATEVARIDHALTVLGAGNTDHPLLRLMLTWTDERICAELGKRSHGAGDVRADVSVIQTCMAEEAAMYMRDDMNQALDMLKQRLADLERTQVELGPLRERLAAYAHEAWSGWMKYQFEKMVYAGEGEWRMPKESAQRWERQMNTEYADLPESEKASDRAEADKMLAICKGITEMPFGVRDALFDSLTVTISQLGGEGQERYIAAREWLTGMPDARRKPAAD